MNEKKVKTLLIVVVILIGLIAVALILLLTLLFSTNGRVFKIEDYIDQELMHNKYEEIVPTLIPTLSEAPYISAAPTTSTQTPEITLTPEHTQYEPVDTPVPSDEKPEPLKINRELDVDDLAIVGLKYGMTESEVRSMYGAPIYYSQWDRWESLDGGWYTYAVYDFGFVTYYNNTMGYKDVGIVEGVKVMKTGSQCP